MNAIAWGSRTVALHVIGEAALLTLVGARVKFTEGILCKASARRVEEAVVIKHRRGRNSANQFRRDRRLFRAARGCGDRDQDAQDRPAGD